MEFPFTNKMPTMNTALLHKSVLCNILFLLAILFLGCYPVLAQDKRTATNIELDEAALYYKKGLEGTQKRGECCAIWTLRMDKTNRDTVNWGKLYEAAGAYVETKTTLQTILTELKEGQQITEQQLSFFKEEKQTQNVILVSLLSSLLLLFGVFVMYDRHQRRQVSKMKTQFESSIQQLQSFNYSVAHELKTPIVQMRGTLHNVAQKVKIPELQQLENALLGMDNLVESMLQFSMIETELLNYSTANTQLLVSDIIAELKPPSHVIFNMNALPVVRADVFLLRHVFSNLIQNAVKFSAKKPRPLIEISAQSQDNKYTFTIKDNGVGFAPEKAEMLFRIFNRLHSKNQYNGFGVGLVIVKSIVEKHGGRVWAQGETDKGAIFGFEIPQ
ncbi:MAG: GHKL domain-containing protein [Runella slithyformis]|nr:MAG: GHKL domain-containing protein [Runella slithyformis]